MRRLLILWYRSIPYSPNKAFYRRIMFWLNGNGTFLLTGSLDNVSNEIDKTRIKPCRFRAYNDGLFSKFRKIISYTINLFGNIRSHDEEKPIVYTFQGLESILGFIAQRLGCVWWLDILDIPYLYKESYTDLFNQKRYLAGFLYWLYFNFTKFSFKRADMIITTSFTYDSGFAYQLISDFGVNKSRIVLTSNGTNLSECDPPHNSPCSPTLSPTLLYIGTVNEERGMLLMLRIVDRLRRYWPDIVLELYGNISMGHEGLFYSQIKNNRLGKNIKYFGERPHNEVVEAINKSDVCLYPFKDSPQLRGVHPIKLFEYMSLKKAIVASDLDAVQYIIQHDISGILCPPDDPCSWETAICRLIKNPTERSKLGEEAHKRVQNFNWEQVHEELFEKLCMTQWKAFVYNIFKQA